MNILLIILIIIIIIIVIVVIYLSLVFPGVFIKWKNSSAYSGDNECDLVSDMSILSNDEVERLRTNISNHKELIRPVNVALDIIGTASYIDGVANKEMYSKLSVATNPQLRFLLAYDDIYERLRLHLEKRIKQRCVYAADRTNNKIALPGFHIFNSKSPLARGWSVASVHVDKQELEVNWPTTEVFDMEKTLSFTLFLGGPPKSGLWITDKKDSKTGFGPLWWTLRNAEKKRIEYEPGHCYLHDGKYFHMISSYYADSEKPVDRITLQGHAIYCKSQKEWWLYW